MLLTVSRACGVTKDVQTNYGKHRESWTAYKTGRSDLVGTDDRGRWFYSQELKTVPNPATDPEVAEVFTRLALAWMDAADEQAIAEEAVTDFYVDVYDD